METRQPASALAEQTLAILDNRLADLLKRIQREPYWALSVGPSRSAAFVPRMLREVLLRVAWYQPRTTEAGFHMIGRLPKSEFRLMRAMSGHKSEEAEHGNWALRDYLRLGGNQGTASQPMSPAAFAVAAVWWQIARTEDPFGYIGAEYLFEELTARVTQALVPGLVADGAADSAGFGFVIDHATEDEKHANLVRMWVRDVVTRHPESAQNLIRCFDYFKGVYPLPLWQEAYDTVLQPVTPNVIDA